MQINGFLGPFQYSFTFDVEISHIIQGGINKGRSPMFRTCKHFIAPLQNYGNVV